MAVINSTPDDGSPVKKRAPVDYRCHSSSAT